MELNWTQIILAGLGIIGAAIGGGTIGAILSYRVSMKNLERDRKKADGEAAKIYLEIATKSGEVQLSAQDIIRDLQAQLAASHLSQQQATKLLADANQKMIDAQASEARAQKQNEDLQKVVRDDLDREDGHIKKIGTLSRELDAQTSRAKIAESKVKILEQRVGEIENLRVEVNTLRKELRARDDTIESMRDAMRSLADQMDIFVKELNEYHLAEKKPLLPSVNRAGLGLGPRSVKL